MTTAYTALSLTPFSQNCNEHNRGNEGRIEPVAACRICWQAAMVISRLPAQFNFRSEYSPVLYELRTTLRGEERDHLLGCLLGTRCAWMGEIAPVSRLIVLIAEADVLLIPAITSRIVLAVAPVE